MNTSSSLSFLDYANASLRQKGLLKRAQGKELDDPGSWYRSLGPEWTELYSSTDPEVRTLIQMLEDNQVTSRELDLTGRGIPARMQRLKVPSFLVPGDIRGAALQELARRDVAGELSSKDAKNLEGMLQKIGGSGIPQYSVLRTGERFHDVVSEPQNPANPRFDSRGWDNGRMKRLARGLLHTVQTEKMRRRRFSGRADVESRGGASGKPRSLQKGAETGTRLGGSSFRTGARTTIASSSLLGNAMADVQPWLRAVTSGALKLGRGSGLYSRSPAPGRRTSVASRRTSTGPSNDKTRRTGDRHANGSEKDGNFKKKRRKAFKFYAVRAKHRAPAIFARPSPKFIGQLAPPEALDEKKDEAGEGAEDGREYLSDEEAAARLLAKIIPQPKYPIGDFGRLPALADKGLDEAAHAPREVGKNRKPTLRGEAARITPARFISRQPPLR